MLSITIHAAKDVRSADPNGFSDPYALVFVGKNKPKKTKIVKKNLSPVWEETFEFPLTRNDKTLQVQVWDWDQVGTDDFLGLVHVDLSPAHAGEKVKDGWLKLQPHPNKKNIQVKGGINISVAVREVKYSAASSKEVEKAVDAKIRNGGTMFDIGGVGAGAIDPAWIDRLPPGLSVINCSFNKLRELPAGFAKFTQLAQLFAAGNQVVQWPPQLCACAQLTEIEINGNELTTLPPQIGKLQALEKLNVANNKLTSLPPTLGYCYHLEDLNLSGNELETVPDAIGNLYHLEVLDLSCNAITVLPEELTYCTRLIELNLGGNRLQALPEAVGRLSRVVNLNVADNGIREFPISIGYCASLAQIGQGLNIDRNPLKDPELQAQFRIGADRLYMYLEKRMFIEGSPQLPPFPNNGRLPYVPLPPIDGVLLGFGSAGVKSGGSSGGLLAPAAAASSGTASPLALKNRKAYTQQHSGSAQASPAVSRLSSTSPAPDSPSATRDEKVEKIRSVAKAVIEQDIRPKVLALRAAVDASKSIPDVQPLVQKVKSLKGDFDAIKTILPAIDKPPTPERAPNEEQLVTLKKVVAVIIMEYDLILGISLTIADVASSKDLVALVTALKRIKLLL